MIIDFHTHTFPKEIAARALTSLAAESGLKYCTDGTIPSLIKMMEDYGIDHSVLLPVVTNARHTEKINKLAIENNTGSPLFSFGGMHPENDDYAVLLKTLSENGVKGIKIHPYFQKTYLDDIRYKRIVSKCCELGLYVVTHAGLDIGFPGQDYATVPHIEGLLKDVEPDHLILAHLGAWNQWNEIEETLSKYPVYLDTAFSLNSGLLSNDRFVKLVNLCGADHVLFGTDSPWSTPDVLAGLIRQSGLSEPDTALILGENARKILDI